MTTRHFLATAIAGASILAMGGVASAQPKPSTCTADFVLSDLLGAHASADVRGAGLDRLYVEMGPARVAMTTKGAGVSGAYEAKTPDLMVWNYMSIYQPAAEWLKPGSVRLDYSGFRIGWPEFRVRGKLVKALKLTVTQGERSMTVNLPAGADGAPVKSHAFAIDFEAMLPGPYPIARVDDHAAWRAEDGRGRSLSITLTDASNGRVIALAEASRLKPDALQSLLSGGLNALRDKFKAGGCR